MVLKGSQTGVSEGSERLWSFAGREFDESRLELRLNGKPVELELKPLEILVQLLLHAGEVVTKDELLDAVWPGLTVVEGSLSTAIYKLRKALGDEDSTVVVTVPRVGYRLEASVQSKLIGPSPLTAELGLKADDAVPGREHWRLMRALDVSAGSEVWLARHPKTRELRVFKFASSAVRLKGLKREVTVSRFLRESLGERPEFVHVLEWNFDTHPCFLESEYGGPNFAEWAESQGGPARIPLQVRLDLLADVARAVASAHAAGVLHKDLKPANILVTPAAHSGWLIKVADFGSASLVEPSRLRALGITNLGITQTGDPRTASLTGTLMYLAPEVLSGQSPAASADVYALGVMLYQLAIGDFRKPISPGWEAGIEDPLIREDIAAAACGDCARRLASAAELAERLLALDRRGTERARLEQTRKREQIAERRRADSRIRRPWIVVAGVVLFISLVLSLSLYRRLSARNPRLMTVAVLPFQDAGSDHSLDFLRLALPDEIATTLSYKRSLSIRPFANTSKYTESNLDLQKAGREMGVSNIVTGHFLKGGDQLQVTLEAVDVESNRLLWRDTLDVPTENMIVMRQQITATAREGLAPVFGSSSFAPDTAARPQNEEAYNLYLHSIAVPGDPVPNKRGIAMLERALGLDPNYAPAWRALALRYYYEARYAAGGEAMIKRCDAAAGRARALDPNFILASTLLSETRVERGELAKAYQEAEDLVRRRPDSGDAHFALSYVLRYAGLLEDAASQCEMARSLDPHNPAWRSCSAVFELRGDYKRALDYIHLDDPGSEWARTHLVELFLRQGNEREAVEVNPTHIPQWESFNMLQACAAHRPLPEIVALASAVQPQDDPEVNYFFASHLAYCGQSKAALQMLKRAIQGNYCSYPAIDSDPFFASVRIMPEFAAIRATGMACQQNFLGAREHVQQQAHQ
jgi:DNA-binding winged helix-turn-helix (wHTH) protein/serine/threonine protein kinase/Flp pilus assembly protein TadD